MRSTDSRRVAAGAVIAMMLEVAAACAPKPGASPAPARSPVALRVEVDGESVAYRLEPPRAAARGVVVLIGVPDEPALAPLLAQAGYATVVPDLSREGLYLDHATMRAIEGVVLDAQRRTGAPPRRVAIGGISLGGTAAVAFAEYCAMGRCDGRIRLKAAFAVDAPLDMGRLWRSAMRQMRRDSLGEGARESRWIADHLVRDLGGPPDAERAAYATRSPFLYDEPEGGNARWLLATPLRLYAEPDMGFWLDTMGFDYDDLNAFDVVALTSRLRSMGHPAVRAILTSGRGHRPDGTRNPHSWSIVDEPDLAAWLVDCLETTS